MRGSWSPGGTAITAVVSLIHRDHNIVRPSNENEANDLISIFDDEDPSHRATGEDLSKSLVAHGTHKLTGFTERGPTSVTTQFSTPSEKRYVNLEYDNRFSSLSLETKKRQDGIPPGASCDLHRLFGAERLRFLLLSLPAKFAGDLIAAATISRAFELRRPLVDPKCRGSACASCLDLLPTGGAESCANWVRAVTVWAFRELLTKHRHDFSLMCI